MLDHILIHAPAREGERGRECDKTLNLLVPVRTAHSRNPAEIIAQAGDLIESRNPELAAAARAALTRYHHEALGQAE
jgi:hypothetical protein